MALSVSSEQAFSQGSITVNKHCNCLEGNIVEVPQCVKYSIHHDLLFCKPGPTDPNEKLSKGDDKEEDWEALFLDEDEDDVESDIKMD